MMVSSSSLPSFLWTIVFLFLSLNHHNHHHHAMAVDRSKFRTCDQTSFCRRHRRGFHRNLFRYQLLPESIHFHHHEDQMVGASSSNKDDPTDKQHQQKSVWKSIQRRILGKAGGAQHHDDQHSVLGPAPTLTGTLKNIINPKELLQLSITAYHHGMVRIRVTETYTTSKLLLPRVTYDELVLHEPGLVPAGHARLWRHDIPDTKEKLQQLIDSTKKNQQETFDIQNYIALEYGDDHHHDNDDKNNNHTMILLVSLNPFQMQLFRGSDLTTPIVQMATDEMMHFEVRRNKPKDEQETTTKKEEETDDQNKKEDEPQKEEEKEIVGYWEDGLAIYADGTREEKKEIVDDHRQLTEDELDKEGLWEERFGSHTDSKPYGPMSVGMDVTFPKSKHLFGIPEHASSAQLKTTLGENAHYTEPYRLYNLDVFEYELDETMALYGHVPFVVSQSIQTGTTGVFWFNPTETFVDVAETESDSKLHWISESGIIDMFLLPGPDPSRLYQQYALLTSTTPLPPMFSLGYHQCRWNYKDEKDVDMVHSKFEELDYPYDVLWLDIEHTDGKRYFTWDKNMFPNPKEMQQRLAAQGRRMVTIIDPHIKRDNNYYIHKEATNKGLYIKDSTGKNDYDGWCWPGSSSYLDFTAEHVRSWWADQFAYEKYEGSTPTLFTWNDMNEPSVFNGPEVSMQKDLLNLQGEEHREWHNLYGMLFHRATGEGQVRRNQPEEDTRPFVLSRSFFAGSQRYGAIWTGDNKAEWEHLQVAAPMLLSLNVAALSFVGADVGGFFGNPDAELFTRWMQAGSYQPFFRGHAHHDSKRREPWMFDDETLVRLRRAAMARYALLPYWYTVFYEAEKTGMPVMRLAWMQYPQTESLFAMDDQYLIGSDLMVKPITQQGVTETFVVFPMDHLWYDVDSMQLVSKTVSPGSTSNATVAADIDVIPVYQRGGSIIPRKLRLRRSTMMMKGDPYTLFVALDEKKKASGRLHLDDGESFGYRKRNEFADATFTADLGVSRMLISNSVVVGSGWSGFNGLADDMMIERIIIMGVSKPPTKMTVVDTGSNLEFSFNRATNVVVVRKPDLSAIDNWSILIH